MQFLILGVDINFNPRSHERSDWSCMKSWRTHSLFQSTLPREERLNCEKIWRFLIQFQSTLPREERPYRYGGCGTPSLFQSTLPREERRGKGGYGGESTDFNPRSHERSDFPSIIKYVTTGISIHAPTRGATQSFNNITNIMHYFNPRSHERSDKWKWYYWYWYRYFNPRSHERSDSNIAQKICLFLYNTDNKYIIR